jgi:hypothetical protein
MTDTVRRRRREKTTDAQIKRWLASYPRVWGVEYGSRGLLPEETSEQRQARLFKDVLVELSLLIDEFGYEAVYFGVGCEAFPDAVDPWSGDGQY